MIGRERALELAAAAAAPLPSEEVEVAAACGRVLAEPLLAAGDVPPFDRSLRDGYALRSADAARAPSALRVAGTLLAGDVAEGTLEPGACWRVMTGAALPAGADAVVMQEEAEERGAGEVEIRRAVARGEHVARAGAEVGRGETLAAAGERLEPVGIGLALASGRARVRVHRRPRVAVLSSGGELVPPGEEPRAGRIRASNPWMLAAAAARAGAEVSILGIVADREEEQRPVLEAGLARDLLLLSGGTGRGQADLTRRALGGCGVEVLYQGVAVDPGRPALCGRRGSALVFALPGTPLAAWVLWRVLVAPCLRCLAGEARWWPRLGPARLASPLDHARGLETWVPADLSWIGVERVARPRSSRGAGGLRQQIGGPALVRIPAGDSGRTEAGAAVDVLEPGD